MKKIFVFDLDDTLISSDAKIRIYDPKSRREIGTLTPAQFNYHKRNKSYFYDFDEFSDSEILNKSKLYNTTFDSLKRFLKNGEDVCILTARGSSSLVYNFFKNKGIELDKSLIYAVGGDDSEYTGSVPERKQQALKELIEKGYTNFRIYDDNIHNLEALKELETDVVKIKTIHVLHGET